MAQSQDELTALSKKFKKYIDTYTFAEARVLHVREDMNQVNPLETLQNP